MQLKRFLTFLLLLNLSSLAEAKVPGQNDSTRVSVKPARHFIRSCIYLNSFGTPERDLIPKNGQAMGRYYQLSESNIGFYVPLSTRVWPSSDSVYQRSFQVIGMGNYARSQFSSSLTTEPRVLTRAGLGVKAIYADGHKNSFFMAIAPFGSSDQYTSLTQSRRLAMAFIYNWTIDPKFSLRFGFMRTYVFGRSLGLPIIGFRWGRLDDIHLNVQLFRNISLNMPAGKYFYISAFTRPTGSVYRFKNTGALYAEQGLTLDFRRYEILTGVQVNFKPHRNLSIYTSIGSSKGQATLATINGDKIIGKSGFQQYTLERTGFITFGLQFFIGRSRNIAGNYQMYDAIDLNNTYGNDDNNIGIQNQQIPARNKKMQVNNLQYQDISDLIRESDIY